jgi:hypothetical protein
MEAPRGMNAGKSWYGPVAWRVAWRVLVRRMQSRVMQYHLSRFGVLAAQSFTGNLRNVALQSCPLNALDGFANLLDEGWEGSNTAGIVR